MCDEKPLTFEVGKTYVCRDGSLQIVYLKTSDKLYIYNKLNPESTSYRNSYGSCDIGYTTPYDLVKEYKEPNFEYINVYKNLGTVIGNHRFKSINSALESTNYPGHDNNHIGYYRYDRDNPSNVVFIPK